MNNKAYFSKYEVSVEVEEISPAIAEFYLDNFNVQNRNPSNIRVKEYADIMKKGMWYFNGDVIRFDTTGTLIDGQHRLLACVASGVTIDALVIRGIKPKTKCTIDTGKVRTGGDALAIDCGVTSGDAAAISSCIKLVNIYNTNNSLIPSMGGGHSKTNNAETKEIYSNNKEELDNVLLLAKKYKTSGSLVPRGDIMFLMLMFLRKNKELAVPFLDKVLNGENISSTDSEYMLRDILTASKMGVRKLNRFQVISSVIRTWNAIQVGRPYRTKNGIIQSKGDANPVIK